MDEDAKNIKNIAEDFVSQFNQLSKNVDSGKIKEVAGKFVETYNEYIQQEDSENLSKTLSNDEITIHTANMWRYNPVPENQPETFPEYKSLFMKLPECEITASRVRGKKHKHEGSNCDDWFEVSNYGKIACAAVADGAGSKKFSRVGAKISCMSAVSYMRKSLEKLFTENPDISEKFSLPVTDSSFLEICGLLASIVQNSVISAAEAVETAFKSRSCIPEYSQFLERELSLNDFSSTLLTAMIIPIDKNSKECIIITCQIGDGAVALINADDNSVKLMGVPDSGDFSGETDFLTSPKMKNIETLQNRTKISKSPVSAVLMMTDGVADDYFPNETQMLRLYFDLIINGIIPCCFPEFSESDSNKDIIKKIPEPIGYPCVNDKSKTVFLRYTNRICSALNISLNDLSQNKHILSAARSDEISETPEKILTKWLDNYVERGSFDDRTLVIVRLPEDLS